MNGGALEDTFIFYEGVVLDGNIDGRGGTDTIDLSRLTTGISIDLAGGFASNIAGGITSIEYIAYSPAEEREIEYAVTAPTQRYYLHPEKYYLHPEKYYLHPDVFCAHEGIEYDLNPQESTILALEIEGQLGVWNSDFVVLPAEYASRAKLTRLSEKELPAPLPSGYSFIKGIHIYTDHTDLFSYNETGSVFIDFLISNTFAEKELAILIWDTRLNDGQGGWVEITVTRICCSEGFSSNSNMIRYEIRSIADLGDGWISVTIWLNSIGNTDQDNKNYAIEVQIQKNALLNGLEPGRNHPFAIEANYTVNTFEVYNAVADYLLSGLFGQDSGSQDRDSFRLSIETDQPEYVVLAEKVQ